VELPDRTTQEVDELRRLGFRSVGHRPPDLAEIHPAELEGHEARRGRRQVRQAAEAVRQDGLPGAADLFFAEHLQHRGTIEVSSEVGRGTTFTVRLPVGA
jgi:hypothetical protein